jgi:hypothetical protein
VSKKSELRANLSRSSPIEALDAFLLEHPPEGAGIVRAALARRLAESLDTAPPYAVSRIGNVLARLLDDLDESTEVGEALRSNLSWLREAS